jgi:hypothetical protein
MIRSWLVVVNGLGATTKPPFGSFASVRRVESISAALRTPAAVTVTPNEAETAQGAVD